LATSEYASEKVSEAQEIPESWGDLLKLMRFLQEKGMMAEITTRFEIKPMLHEKTEQMESNERRKKLVQTILRKHSRNLSVKLRKDFSLGEITSERIDLSLLDGLLSEYADEEEDSVELIKSTRKRF